MTRATTALFGLLAAALLPGGAEALEGVSRFTLPNGLQGVVIEDHRAPVVVQMLWYRVGSADDPEGRSGLAHFLEHLMFKGSAQAPEQDFSRVVSANGGDDNAFTNTDATAYFQEIAADRLELVMQMEADRMAGLDPDAEGVRAERDVVLEERRQVVETDPGGPFHEALRAAQFLNHPYRRPIIGWAHEIAAFDLEAAQDFFKAHYAPNNAILVVAGDVRPAEVEALAARHYGRVPAVPDLPPRRRPQEPPPIAARRLELRDARVARPAFSRSYLAPARRLGDQREAAALVLLDGLLGGGITSELAQALQVDAQLALDTGSFYDSLSLDPSVFALSLAPWDGVEPAAAEAALDRVLARFIADGPDPEALARLKTRFRAREVYALDNPRGRAEDIGGALVVGLDVKDVEEWPALVQAVTAEEVRAAAEALFRPESSVSGWLLPPGGDPAAAEAGR